MKGKSPRDLFGKQLKIQNCKKAFTLVEIIIVIAVISVLAAVLIPSFASLSAKAQSTAALAQAKNRIDEILSGNPAANSCDIVVISEKGGKLFAFAYDFPYGRIISYAGNPVSIEKDFDFISADDIPEIISGISVRENSSEERSSDVLVIKGVTINPDFEKGHTVTGHKCLDFLEYHEETTATCTIGGRKAYYSCKTCGAMFEKAADGTFSECENTEIPPSGHDYFIAYDSVYHFRECRLCHDISEKAEHKYTGGVCECGKSEKPDEWSGTVYP